VAFTSATPLKLPGKQEALFREVLVFLEEAHRPYAIAGAFALRQHTGICRFTKDLDIFLRSEDTPETLAGLHRHRFECEICDPVWLAKAHRDGFFVDLITGMSNGVISVDASWIERAHRTQILGVETRVLAPEELVASKLFVTRRERFDGADLVHIIHATRGKLDWGRILELAGEHWELVLWNLVLFRYVYPAESGYVPQSLWQDLLGRFGAEVRVPDRHARFRGSLIDDATFAIDVAEWGLDDLFTESRARRPKIEAAPCASRV
jgi:hypothetical protein